MIKIGELLHEASEKTCDHGDYLNWLKQFGWSYQTSLNYRNVFEFDANPPPQKPNGWVFGSVGDLNISMTALYLIAAMKREDQQSARLAVIAAAKSGRVTYRIAKAIIAETNTKLAAADEKTEPEGENTLISIKPTPEPDAEADGAATSLDDDGKGPKEKKPAGVQAFENHINRIVSDCQMVVTAVEESDHFSIPALAANAAAILQKLSEAKAALTRLERHIRAQASTEVSTAVVATKGKADSAQTIKAKADAAEARSKLH